MPLRNVRPKKALGQHFLTDPLIARRIAETIPESFRSLPVLEIGPGMGILTRELMDICPDLYLLEIDGESIDYLSAAFPSLFAEQRVVKGDVLRCTDEAFIPGKPDTAFVMTGNYPYNISGRLFFRIFELHDRIPCCTGTIVVDRVMDFVMLLVIALLALLLCYSDLIVLVNMIPFKVPSVWTMIQS